MRRYEPHGTAELDSKGRAKYTITLPMLRRHQFYVTNVMAIMSAICFLAFTAFAMPTEEFEGPDVVSLGAGAGPMPLTRPRVSVVALSCMAAELRSG